MEITSADKVMFPGTVGGRKHVTKGDVVEHYRQVGPRMLDFVAGRPLTLQRFPRGIDAKGFMQKNAADHFPATIERHSVPKRDGGETVYPVVRSADDLAYLANQNTITFHMWTSTVETPGHPDWMVIDLDPEAGDVAKVRAATRTVREVLTSFDLDGFVLATGSKGFHVWVRLDGRADFGAVSLASRAIGGLAVAASPHELTSEFLKKNRGGRVFVDWLRNSPTSTVVVPFSLRPRPGASVAVPVAWNELDAAEPNGWVIGGIHDRLVLDVEHPPVALPVDDIVAAARTAGVDLDTPHDRFGRR